MKTKAKHTPGEWSVDSSDWPIIINGPAGSEQDVVAIVHRVGQMTCYYDDATAIANANLIAAAPKLYDAVMQVLIAGEDGGDMDDIDWNQLRAAIAKAEGY